MQTITTIGVDIAKSVFQVHGVDANGKVVGVTALIAASQNGYLDVVQALLTKGAEVDARRNDDGVTALDAATAEGYVNIRALLVQAGAKPEGSGGFLG
jgi:ankyrin repeat protein